MILLLVCVTSFGQQVPQNQNAVWLFGNQAGLNFLPDPENPTLLSHNIYFNESCATVSDQNGNLLFSTDGITVRNNNGNVLANGTGLFSNSSNTQGVVILLRPGHSTYYIATIDGATGGGRGIHYSEVDMSLGVNGTVLLTNKNTPLNDSDENPFGAFSQVSSEKLTSTVHANGVDYWLVTQIADEIYSYQVTSSGITSNPVVSQAPINTHTPPLGEPNLGVGQMKISPNTSRIGICYYQNFDIGINGALALGDFNNMTGEVIFDEDLIQLEGEDHTGYYGVEFSPNSEFVYFTTRGESEITSGRSTEVTEQTNYVGFYRVNSKKTNTKKTPLLIAQEIIPQTKSIPIQTPDLGLQLAINGKIYSIVYPSPTSFITVINNPNDGLDPDYTVTNLSPGGTNMPQWVHNHTLDICPAHIELDTEPHTLHTYEYSDFIVTNSNYSISDGQDITLQAGNFIVLDPNTYIFKGGICLAHIDDCGEIIGSSTSSSRMAVTNTENSNIKETTEDLTLFPNPTSNFVEINYQKGISNIIVTSIDGKTIYQGAVNNTTYTLDTKTFTEGIYLVSIQTNEGDIITKKLIVK